MPPSQKARPASGYRIDDPEDHGLVYFLNDLKTEKRAEACDQFHSIISEAEPAYSEHDWVVVIDSLVHSNCVQSIELARDILQGKYPAIKPQWFSQRSQLRKIMEYLIHEPSGLRDLKEDELHQITNAYRGLLERLEDMSGSKDLCAQFWIKLFNNASSVYYAKAVNSFDQHEYIDEADQDARLAYLHGVQSFLAKSHEKVFEDERCWPDLDAALCDCLELCLDDIKDGHAVAQEVSRILNTCIGVAVESPKTKRITPHGAVIRKVLWSLDNNSCDFYKSTIFKENIDTILEWAAADQEAQRSRSAGGNVRGINDLGEICRDAVFDEAAKNHPEQLAIHGKQVVRIYKKFPTERVVGGIAAAYPHISEEVDRNFDDFFENLFDFKGFPKPYYDLFEAIAEKSPDLFTGSHISRLVGRMGQHEEDIPFILDVILVVTKNNTPVMQGRGQDYHQIAIGCEGIVNQKENVEKTNEIMVWMAYASEDEAERVVKLMYDAYMMVSVCIFSVKFL